MKKLSIILLIGVFVLALSVTLFAEPASVGGHVKLTVYDRPSGEHNGVSTSNYVGFSFKELILYVSKELTDKISVDMQPMFSASTGATPSFGNDIAKKADAGSVEPEFHGFVKAQVNVLLPGDYELGFGVVKPRFSWDYGAELFWEDEGNGSKFTTNNYLGAVHDGGIEVYKNFELGSFSLPTWVYILNGGFEFSDNNSQPSILATVEPEIGALKFKVSLNYGKYDTDAKNSFMKYLVGAMWEKGPFSLRAEYGAGTWSNSIVTASDTSGNPISFEDATPMGFYGKLFYRFASWGRLMLHYDYVDNNYTGFFYTARGAEKYVTIIPGMQIYLSESSILQIQYDIADWKQTEKFGIPGQEDTIKYNRMTVTWRTTF